jgi:hypothetical protein
MKARVFVASFLIAWFGLSAVAFAAQVAAPSVAPAELASGSIWKGILSGLLAGVIAAVTGWLKNKDARTGDHEEFDIKFVVPTAMVGAVVGVVAALLKKSPTDFISMIENSPLFAAITLGAEYVIKIVWRHGVFHLKDVLGDIKTGAGNPTPPAPPTQ